MKAEIKRGFVVCNGKVACLECLTGIEKKGNQIELDYYYLSPDYKRERQNRKMVFDYEEKLYNDLHDIIEIRGR